MLLKQISLLFLLVAALGAAGADTAVAAAPSEPKVEEKAEPKIPPDASGKELSRELRELGGGDPFRYSISGTDDYMPTAGNKSVSGIAVKGIVRLKGKESVALLQLADSGRSFYVRKGNVIHVTNPKSGASATETYLQVKEIRDDEVEVIQKERPDRVIIVR